MLSDEEKKQKILLHKEKTKIRNKQYREKKKLELKEIMLSKSPEEFKEYLYNKNKYYRDNYLKNKNSPARKCNKKKYKEKTEHNQRLETIKELYNYGGFVTAHKQISKINFHFVKLEQKVKKILEIPHDALYIQIVFYSKLSIKNCKYIIRRMNDESYSILKEYINYYSNHIEVILETARFFVKEYREHMSKEYLKQEKAKKFNEELRDKYPEKKKFFRITKIH